MSSHPIHGSAFAYLGVGCLILGEPGSGKSRLLAEALMLGAELIGDDQLLLTAEGQGLIASPAPTIAGVMEVRGLGLIRRSYVPSHHLHIAVKFITAADHTPSAPAASELAIAGVSLPVHPLPASPPVGAAGLLLFLRAMQEGRVLPTDWHPMGA